MRRLLESTHRHALKIAATLLVAVLLAPAAVMAQTETGQITGTVSDEQGAVVPNASVTVKNVDTGETRSTTATGSGDYTVANLKPGVYDVTVTATNFAPATRRAQVAVGTPTALDVEVSVTGTAEIVNVVAGESGIQANTENQVLQTTVTERQLKELPEINRNPYAFVQLSGNVAPGQGVAAPSGRGVGVAINGQRETSTNILLDGADNNDQFGAALGQDVPLDAVQEFSVLTSNFSPEFGRASGGVVNVATKAGTNEFHGTVYEFNRNSALAAALVEDKSQPLQTPIEKAKFNRNQFGFSVGGPIVEDKLLFFSSFEWLRVRSSQNVRYLIATPELIGASSPGTQAFFAPHSLAPGVFFTGRTLTVGDIVAPDSGAFSELGASFPAFSEVISTLPGNVGAGFPQNTWYGVGRADWNATEKTSLYVRYGIERLSFPLNPAGNGIIAQTPYAGFQPPATGFNNNILGSLTHVWGDRFVTQSKFVFNRYNTTQPYGDQPIQPTLYLTQAGAFAVDQSGVGIAFPGYGPFTPAAGVGFSGPQNLAQFYQDANYTFGQHQIRFGGSYVRIHDDRVFGAYETAQEFLARNSVTEGLNNLVVGRIYNFTVAAVPNAYPLDIVEGPLTQTKDEFARNNRYNEWALYFNDAWRIHPRLTLNLGVRYDYFGVQHNKDQSLDSNFYLGEGSNLFERINTGRVLPVSESPIGRLWQRDLNNIGPRIGVAWDVLGDGSTVLRGGYGISFERNFGNVTFNVIQNPPNNATISGIAVDFNRDFLPIYTSNLGPVGESGTFRLPKFSLRAVDPNIKTAYAHFWSAALEREVWGSTLLSASYSGSKGVDLYSISNVNPLFAGAVFLGLPVGGASGQSGVDPFNTQARLNRQYTGINFRTNGGFSNYNGLTLGVESRDLGKIGLQFTAKYTWSHAIDNLSSTFSEGQAGNFNLGFTNPFDPNADKGDADFDVRHRFVSSFVWSLPFAKDVTGAKKYVLDGWTLTGIFTASTGAPFSIFDCTNAFTNCPRIATTGPLDVLSNPREEIDGGPNNFTYVDLSSQSAGFATIFNPAATAAVSAFFGAPVLNSDFVNGTAGRNSFRAPGTWNLDTGISKNIPISEGVSLQLRAEFFNVFNHSNLYINTGSTAFDFSLPVSVAAPYVTVSHADNRQIQLAAKIIF